MKQKNCYGFGVEPDITQNHFYVVIINKKESNAPVQIYERYTWTTEEAAAAVDENTVVFADHQILDAGDILKLEISRHKWDMVAKDLAAEFNNRLKSDKKPAGKFANGGTPVERMFGKEMMILLWAIEDVDPGSGNIQKAVQNWKGLQPEERWWLYTMTNASTGELKDNGRGWRMALRYALCENPVVLEKHEQLDMFTENKEN